jgi:hypothetical protein
MEWEWLGLDLRSATRARARKWQPTGRLTPVYITILLFELGVVMWSRCRGVCGAKSAQTLAFCLASPQARTRGAHVG